MHVTMEVMVRGYHQLTACALPWSKTYLCQLFAWERSFWLLMEQCVLQLLDHFFVNDLGIDSSP